VEAELENIDQISASTSFNGKALLDGSFSQTFYADGENGVEVAIGDTRVEGLGLSDLDVTTTDGAVTALGTVDDALNQVSNMQADLGAYQNRMDSTVDNLWSTLVNQVDAHSRIVDADVASETSALASARIREYSGVAMMAQAHKLFPQKLMDLLL
jgi:flagellin